MNYLVHSLSEMLRVQTAKAFADDLELFHLDLNDLVNKNPLSLTQTGAIDVLEHYAASKKTILEQFSNFKNTVFTVSGYGFLDESNLKHIKEHAKIIFLKTDYKTYLEFYKGSPNKKLQKLSFDTNTLFFESFSDMIVKVKTNNINKILKEIKKLLIS